MQRHRVETAAEAPSPPRVAITMLSRRTFASRVRATTVASHVRTNLVFHRWQDNFSCECADAPFVPLGQGHLVTGGPPGGRPVLQYV